MRSMEVHALRSAARPAGASSCRHFEKVGGGIHSTVRATRSASEDALSTAFKERLTQMIHKGITTVEVKEDMDSRLNSNSGHID